MDEPYVASDAHSGRNRLASARAVRLVLERLRAMLPHVVPSAEPEMLYFLRCLGRIAHADEQSRVPQRVGPWKTNDLLRAGVALRGLLGVDETRYGVSLEAFIERYVEILLLPGDVEALLETESVSLEEAELLGQLRAHRLGMDASEAIRERARIYLKYRELEGDVDALRRIVTNRLRVAARVMRRPSEPHWPSSDDGLPCFGSRHLFWEQLTLLRLAFEDIEPEDLTDREVDDLVTAADHVWTALLPIWRRRRLAALEHKYSAMARGIRDEEPEELGGENFGK